MTYTPWTTTTIQAHADDMAKKQALARELAYAALVAKGKC